MSFLILLLQAQFPSHTPPLVSGAKNINDQPHTIRSHLTSRRGRTVESSHEADSISKSHSNSISIIQMVKRSELGLQFPPKSKNVIGIDFGTSTLAVCFVTSAKDELYSFRIHDEDADYSTPTILLIDQDNKIEIGGRAYSCYTDLATDVNNIIFFDKVKLELQHDKVCININLLLLYTIL